MGIRPRCVLYTRSTLLKSVTVTATRYVDIGGVASNLVHIQLAVSCLRNLHVRWLAHEILFWTINAIYRSTEQLVADWAKEKPVLLKTGLSSKWHNLDEILPSSIISVPIRRVRRLDSEKLFWSSTPSAVEMSNLLRIGQKKKIRFLLMAKIWWNIWDF